MSLVFLPRSDTNKKTPTKGQTLRQFLAAEGLAGKLDDVSRFNWGTTDPAEVNRALVELVGCSDAKPDPLDSVLDPDLGSKKAIHVPTPWKPETKLALEKTHTIKVKKRLPVPAVAITKMTSWFVPKTGSCEVEYTLEGVSARADKVDFEVHATAYHAIGKGDVITPCDTDDDADTTHVFRRAKTHTVDGGQRRPAAGAKITWNGASEAKKGVLAKAPSKEAWISHACAPYTVNLRFYKDDADKKAKITLEPFVVRWQPPPNQATVVDASLVVKWAIKDDNAKLKAGQLLVFDKADKVVFRAPLDEGKLRGGTYDLANDATKKWPKVGIKPADMPYRIQIQAHSDEDEENGLALAAMPTVVRAFRYAKVQLVAFNVKPGTKATGTGKKQKIEYLGEPKDEDDIKRRCDIMKDAIRTAYATADANADTLKVFMAPEFYFRGRQGAYPVELLSDIPKQMREETDKFDYVDWLFVMGTSIGSLQHEQLKKDGSGAGKSIRYEGEDKHNVAVESVTVAPKTIRIESKLATPVTGWKVRQGKHTRTIGTVTALGADKYTVTVDKLTGLAVAPAYLLEPVAVVIDRKTDGGKKKILVRSKICGRIPSTDPDAPKAVRWLADQGWLTQSAVTECVHHKDDDYWLTLSNNKNFDRNKAVTLIEPVATEVFNVAQVQRGWPSPALHVGLTAAVIDKEEVSAIDYIGKNYGNCTEWFSSTGLGHVVDIHGVTDRTVLPMAGADVVLGASPNTIDPNEVALGNMPDTWQDKATGATHTIGSEVNVSGIGGGSVITIDGVTLGIEVCLDHMCNRLANFYRTNVAASGDPKVQVQLIPSWGMSIGGGKVVTRQSASKPGVVFNVDGQRSNSVARVTDRTFRCEAHAAQNRTTSVPCADVAEFYVCQTCNSVVGNAPGTCSDGHAAAPLVRYYQCGVEKSFYICPTCNWVGDAAGNCPTDTTDVLVEYHACANCKKFHLPSGACGCAKPWDTRCEAYYEDGGDCGTHASVPLEHGEYLKQIGTIIAFSGGAVEVPSAKNTDLFMNDGKIQLYAVTNLPAAEAVP